MDMQRIEKLLAQVDDLEDLDTLLRSRRSLRDVYSFLGDAWLTTHNATFHLYMQRVAQAGQMLNADLERWVQRVNTLHFEPDDDAPSANPGKGE